MKITSRLIRLNRAIIQAHVLHSECISMVEPRYPSPIEELQSTLEEIIYWLRKTADELIGLSFLCNADVSGSNTPHQIKVDNIGELLSGCHSDLRSVYADNLPHLELLNNISNAYKHSFINSDLNVMGRDEPVVYALGLPRNSLLRPEEYYSVSLSTIVFGFDAFFQAAKVFLRTWPTKN